MKIEILKENLKTGIGMVERVASKNLSLPILDGVLISAEDSFLNLISTNMETTVSLWILAKIIRIGRAVVPARFLSSYISLLPDEKITIETDKQSLRVKCNNLSTQIQGYDPADFPIIPKFINSDCLEIESEKLYRGISCVAGIASPSQFRPEISGIYFYFSKNNLKIAATDSFRLAEKNILLDQPVKKDYSFILPQKPAIEIMNALEKTGTIIKLCISNNQVMFEVPMKETKHPQIQIISRLIEGEYPNYQDIIPTKFKSTFTLKKDEFLNQVKTAALFSGKTNEVSISIKLEEKAVEVFAASPDIGENRSTIAAKIEGEGMKISFNYRYLIDGISNIKSSEINFCASKEDGPCVIRPVGDFSYTYVAMPIKSL